MENYLKYNPTIVYLDVDNKKNQYISFKNFFPNKRKIYLIQNFLTQYNLLILPKGEYSNNK